MTIGDGTIVCTTVWLQEAERAARARAPAEARRPTQFMGPTTAATGSSQSVDPVEEQLRDREATLRSRVNEVGQGREPGVGRVGGLVQSAIERRQLARMPFAVGLDRVLGLQDPVVSADGLLDAHRP